MNRLFPLVAVGGVAVAVVSFLAFSTQNEIIPDQFVEIQRGNEFIITVSYKSNQTLSEGSKNVHIKLTAPAVLSFVNYTVGYVNVTPAGIGVLRLANTTYTVKYEDFLGKKELSGNDTSGTSFNAKIGTDVTYDISHEIMLFEGETAQFKYRFNTNAAQSGTYYIKASVNDHPLLYRINVKA